MRSGIGSHRPYRGRRGRDTHGIGRTSGFSALETVLAASIFLVLVGGGYSVVNEGTRSWSSITRRTSRQSRCRDGMRLVLEEMKQGSDFEIDFSDPAADTIRFMLPLTVAGGQVVWGGRELGSEAGAVPGGFVEYRIVKLTGANGRVARHLIRSVLDDRGRTASTPALIARDVDDLRNGRKGFEVIRNGRLYTVALRVASDPAGASGSEQFELQTTVLPRNADTPALTASAPTEATTPSLHALGSIVSYLDKMVTENPNTPLADRVEDALASAETAQSELQKSVPDTESAIRGIDGAINDIHAAKMARLLDRRTADMVLNALRGVRRSLR
jgi:hypothetical protein